jgi:dsDNA-binding SOS-regulon protein
MNKIFVNLMLSTMLIAGVNTWVYASDPSTPKKSSVPTERVQATPDSQKTLVKVFGADESDEKWARLRGSGCNNLYDVYVFLRTIDIKSALDQAAAKSSISFKDVSVEDRLKQALAIVLQDKKDAFKEKFKESYTENPQQAPGPKDIIVSHVNRVVNDITKNEFLVRWDSFIDYIPAETSDAAEKHNLDGTDNNNIKRTSLSENESDGSGSNGSSGSTTPKTDDLDINTGLTPNGKSRLVIIFGEQSDDSLRAKLEGSGFENTNDLAELVTFLLDFEVKAVSEPTDDLRREQQKAYEDKTKAALKAKFKGKLKDGEVNRLVNDIVRPAFVKRWELIHNKQATTGAGSATTGAGPATTGAGSATTGAGSATTGAGSATTGAGSATTGAGSNSPVKQTFFGKHRKTIVGCGALVVAGAWLYKQYSNPTQPQVARQTAGVR